MATLTSKGHTFDKKVDNYMTPKSAWEQIKHLIPNNKVIWEPFYGDGKSGEYLKELGFNVIHEDIVSGDFYFIEPIKSNDGKDLVGVVAAD